MWRRKRRMTGPVRCQLCAAYRWQRTKFQQHIFNTTLHYFGCLFCFQIASGECYIIWAARIVVVVVICISSILHCTGHARQLNFSCVCIYIDVQLYIYQMLANTIFSVIFEMCTHVSDNVPVGVKTRTIFVPFLTAICMHKNARTKGMQWFDGTSLLRRPFLTQ